MSDKRISLYPVGGINISDLLREAHPQGGPIIGGDKEGKVEDSIEAQIKNLESFYKKPAVITLAQLAERLEAVGAIDLAEQIDKVASGLFHKSALVKKGGTEGSPLNSLIHYTSSFLKQINSFIHPSGSFMGISGAHDIGEEFLSYLNSCISFCNKILLGNFAVLPSFFDLLSDFENQEYGSFDGRILNQVRNELKRSIEYFSKIDKKVYYKAKVNSIIELLKQNQSLAEKKANSNSLFNDNMSANVDTILQKYQPIAKKIIDFYKKIDYISSESFDLNTNVRIENQLIEWRSDMDKLKSELSGVAI
jgi:hypothetical protein